MSLKWEQFHLNWRNLVKKHFIVNLGQTTGKIAIYRSILELELPIFGSSSSNLLRMHIFLYIVQTPRPLRAQEFNKLRGVQEAQVGKSRIKKALALSLKKTTLTLNIFW
ncbi:hypothetical protein PPYR_13998 [Photinus pyralis]|uniref:Uncharacterized protein n=1 Tax=Photinus pyralis TaxID=7054 RepID=A0A5N4A401_PHOPY|nr:hypothetical protein PPYR_13998 [Photinus pyralis]